jgi:hypothetical protein
MGFKFQFQLQFDINRLLYMFGLQFELIIAFITFIAYYVFNFYKVYLETSIYSQLYIPNSLPHFSLRLRRKLLLGKLTIKKT